MNEYIVITARVGVKGRITLPAPIRKNLGLEEGDLVEVAVRPLKPSTDSRR